MALRHFAKFGVSSLQWPVSQCYFMCNRGISMSRLCYRSPASVWCTKSDNTLNWHISSKLFRCKTATSYQVKHCSGHVLSNQHQGFREIAFKSSGSIHIHRFYCEDAKTKAKKNDAYNHQSQSTIKPEAIPELEEKILTVPNVLTVIRMALSPVLGYLVLQQSFLAACGIFIVAGTTDLLDGYIARRYPSQLSALGSFLDPLADKLLASILFVTLTAVDLLPLWLAVMVIARDVLLMGGGFYVRYISLPPPITLKRYFDISNVTAQLKPMFISKVNTALQLGLVTVTLAAPVFNYVDHSALHALWYLTACSTTVTGMAYMFAKDTFKVLEKSHKSQQK